MPHIGALIFRECRGKGFRCGGKQKTMGILLAASRKTFIIAVDAAAASVFCGAMGDEELQLQYGDILPVPKPLTFTLGLSRLLCPLRPLVRVMLLPLLLGMLPRTA